MAYEQTRLEVQRVCAHVIARERSGRDGHIRLAWTGRGVGTDRLWIEPDGLHRDDGAVQPLTTLVELARFAAVDLDLPFSVGHDTPPAGDRDAPLAVDPADLDQLLAFFAAVWPLLTDLSQWAGVGSASEQPAFERSLRSETISTVTLWPEHFDAAFVWQQRANVGGSPGDASSASATCATVGWPPARRPPARRPAPTVRSGSPSSTSLIWCGTRPARRSCPGRRHRR